MSIADPISSNGQLRTRILRLSIFPLRKRPAASYKERPRGFGNPRANGARKHAGCDLYAPVGTEVLAVEDGEVIAGPYLFYDVVDAVEIRHASGVIVRYGEVNKTGAPGIKVGAKVVAGQIVGCVGKMQTVSQSMLHFELFTGLGKGPLTDRSQKPFMRRADLTDPTAFLDACELKAS
jgi:murein DD-endopeptidase MepM/ murein hydrolase activator NlpD